MIKKEIIAEQYLGPDVSTSQAGRVGVRGFVDSLLERIEPDPRLEELIMPRKRGRVFPEDVLAWTKLVKRKICSKSGKNEVGKEDEAQILKQQEGMLRHHFHQGRPISHPADLENSRSLWHMQSLPQ